MSILSGFIKTRKYRKTSSGYKWQSEDTSSETVYMADGNTAETNLGAIQGITDSLTATSSNIALSAKAGNNLQGQIDTVNSNLANFYIAEIPYTKAKVYSCNKDLSQYRNIQILLYNSSEFCIGSKEIDFAYFKKSQRVYIPTLLQTNTTSDNQMCATLCQLQSDNKSIYISTSSIVTKIAIIGCIKSI